MSTYYIPNPCLLGILLAVSTHDGHQVVFHYPPRPNEYGYKATPLAQQMDALNVNEDYFSSSGSSDDEMSDYEEDSDARSVTNSASDTYSGSSKSNTGVNSLTNNTNYLSGKALLDMLDEQDRRRKRKEHKRQNLVRKILIQSGPSDGNNNNLRSPNSDVDSNGGTSLNNNSKSVSSGNNKTGNNTNNNNNDSGNNVIDKLFGFDVDFLSEVVTPPKQLCNTRFEISVDDMAFLGLPVHVNDDGTWRKGSRTRSKGKSKKKKSSKKDKKKTRKRGESVMSTSTGTGPISNDEGELDEGDSDEDSEEENQENQNDCPMHLFHVVFVMNPPVIEYNYRIDEMFHYVVSRLALVLRYEQEKSNFIWNEASNILQLREKYHNLSINEQWSNIIEQSSLANLIAKSYLALSNSEILNIEINGRLRSFQIPIKKEFSSLPPKQIPVLPGSTLSSISPFNDLGFEGNAHNISEDITTHFALILLDDTETIIKDIKAEKDSVIATFIRMIKPTESLNRLSTLSGLDISEVKLFANHLVYWRRAKAVLPLQPRNIYIVSPIAPMSNLDKDSTAFKSQFPNLPGLPNLLSLISSSSSKPKQLSSIIPSRDHRDLYLDAVTWLLKYGYLSQLHLFLWIKIPKNIKIQVDEELEEESKRKQISDENRQLNTDDMPKTRFTDNTSKAVDSRPPVTSSSSSSMPSSLGMANGRSTKGDQVRIVFEEEDEEDTLLLDPESASALEKRWIAKCLEGKPPETVNLFYKLLKYMNGKNALELFMIEEGISRQDIKKLLSAMDEYIVTVRHW